MTEPIRGVFANRTLNLRSVQAIGYDMDYTLIHYRVDEWERAAFKHARGRLADRGWPVEQLEFDPSAFTLGLTFDLALGNLVKATRFGYVVRAQHGNELLSFDDQRTAYSETVIDLAEDRFEFMNTLFELSRAALWTGLVEQHDQERLPGVHGYAELYRIIDDALGRAHVEGELKAEIVADPDRFVVPDPDLVPTLVDQRLAGRQLLLVTNSDWDYTRKIMAYAVEPHCPPGMGWRDLFDIVIVSADKPRFFVDEKQIYRVEDEDRSLLRPHYGDLEAGHVYFGGNARMVERSLDLNAAQVLYVGDHLFGDVHVTKDTLRWRTALIARELEAEIADAADFADDQLELTRLMTEKTEIDRVLAGLRMERRRARKEGGSGPKERQVAAATDRSQELDKHIAPLARRASELGNPTWGPLMRGGNDKSLFARQVERYADVYTSRVSNLRAETPYAYLRAARGSLPHDQRPS
ncbi:MAG: HAD-IG family 5'-nucleotidase [Actinomycetia bacterium]|nr:HAD-IG family 5'-nucleotidase [Actinomycetes bacterium]MCP4083492.1 HAD-IG family 5'-nucleotidase [Actinomycetes bacterium]